MPNAPASSTEFMDLLHKSGVACPEKLAGVSDLALPAEPQKVAALLVAQGVVTRFQAQQLLAGRHKGFRIGAYVILDLLGRGGMGAVYLGEHRELHRKVAIKVLVPGRDEDQKLALERFQREARAAAALDHPNIVRIFDVARFGETPYLVMEYIEGETLQQALDRDGAMAFATATEYVAQAAAGLQHAHEKGFVHRDIKPANLIRDKSGAVKILDMGLARSDNSRDKLTEQLDNGAVVGTADFIAPEQGMNQAVDVRADIYSLGATFFSLLIGKPPFDGNTTQKLLQHQLKNPPSLASIDATLPKGLGGVVAKMLAKKAADRYQTPADVIAALAPWLGNSTRVLAGISRTKLAQGADLQATLSEIGRGSSRRLGVTDSGEVNPSQAAQETGSVAAAVTTRDTPRTTEPAPAARPARKKVALYAGIGVAVLVAGVVAGWLAFAPSKKQPAAVEAPPRTEPEPKKIDAPKTDPNPVVPKKEPNPVVPKKDSPPATETVVFRSDFAALKPFVVRSGLSVDPNDANRKTYRFVSQSGPGAPPAGWTARAWNKDTEMELFAEDGAQPALGMRNVSGPGAAMIFMPKFDCPSGVCRLRVEYSAAVRDGKFIVRFKASDNRPAWDVVRPAVTGPAWRAEEVEADLKGASGGYFEFHNNDDRPDAAVRLRSVTVTAVGGTVAKERALYSLDAADLPAFKNSKQGRTKTAGDDDPRVKGVYFGGWKPETLSEWECGPVAGAKAVGLTNLNEIMSAQIGLELEKADGIGLKLDPGARVRLRVVYRTTGKGRGSTYFQTLGDSKVPDRAALPNSNDAWATVDLVTVRGDRGLRCLIDTSEQGAGNTLFVRSVTVAELGKGTPVAVNPPTNPTPPADPNDPARWAEGAAVFALDVSKIPAFRVQKEKGTRIGGDAEQLPPGVGCHCWKDGAVGDFRCEQIDGVPALSVTNLNDEKSGQFFFSLEGGMKVPLQPGKAYRVKIGYMTRNEAAGNATVQVAPGYKGIGSAKLANTSGKWATAAVSFVRPAAEDKVEVRMVVDNSTVGEGNAVCVRSLEIVELLPPAKK